MICACAEIELGDKIRPRGKGDSQYQRRGSVGTYGFIVHGPLDNQLQHEIWKASESRICDECHVVNAQKIPGKRYMVKD